MAVKITEIPCPKCGKDIEAFIRDGALAADSECTACGHVVPAGTRA